MTTGRLPGAGCVGTACRGTDVRVCRRRGEQKVRGRKTCVVPIAACNRRCEPRRSVYRIRPKTRPNDEERSDVYYLLGMAYNAKGNAPEKTIEAMKKVTAGDKVAVAQKAIADLSQNK